jgi:hypothetical protein
MRSIGLPELLFMLGVGNPSHRGGGTSIGFSNAPLALPAALRRSPLCGTPEFRARGRPSTPKDFCLESGLRIRGVSLGGTPRDVWFPARCPCLFRSKRAWYMSRRMLREGSSRETSGVHRAREAFPGAARC